MKKKLIFSVLGVSFLTLVFKRIRKESKKLIAADLQTEYWRWLCGVWEEYVSLDSYFRDQRTFGNKVWDEGVDQHLKGLFHELDHYPGRSAFGFKHGFEKLCFDLRTRALLEWAEINKLLLLQDREGLTVHSKILGDLLTQLNHLVERERIHAGVV